MENVKRTLQLSPDTVNIVPKRIRIQESETLPTQSFKSEISNLPKSKSEFVSTENFKLEISNLPKPITYLELRRLILEKQKLKAKKIKFSSNSKPAVAFITFEDLENRDGALEVLNGLKYRNAVLKVKVAPGLYPSGLGQQVSRKTYVDESSFAQAVVNSVCPLQHMRYSAQLKQKEMQLKHVVKDIVKSVINVNSDLKPHNKGGKWIKYVSLDVPSIIASPVVDEYRNKCEFTFGFDPFTERCLGFRASSFRKGCVSVGSIYSIRAVPSIMKKVVNAFGDLMQYSYMTPYDPSTGTGFFHTLTVRTTSTGEVMLCLAIRPDEDPKKSSLDVIKNSINEIFGAANKDHGITSFYVKEMEVPGQKTKNVPILSFGSKWITEDILGLKFQISPDAFFQVNSACAEKLFMTIAELAQLDENTTLLDVCSGTGTIGLACCKLTEVGEIIGIESCAAAQQDALRNAVLNNYCDRVRFCLGTAESCVDAAINSAKFAKIVAVVDPPRAGLLSSVVSTLRRNRKIQRIIYVACKLEACKENLISFARPTSKKYQGDIFIPEKIVALDMFPHTMGVECVIVLKRLILNATGDRCGSSTC